MISTNSLNCNKLKINLNCQAQNPKPMIFVPFKTFNVPLAWVSEIGS
jgi:hypothetical protein